MKAGGGDGGSSVSDEEWERFLRASLEGVPDAPEEPSARDRAAAARRPPERAADTAWRAYTPPRRRSRKGWYVAGFVASVALLAVAFAPGGVTGLFGDDARGADAAPLAPESVAPTAPPDAGPEAVRPTLAEPFKGSPAARWADGPAGITVPEARATGWMDRVEVARALRLSRDFLVASNLEPGVLRGERPAGAIALINPRQRDVQDYLAAAFRSPGEANDPVLLFSRFDPAQARLVGDVVKTRGRLTYAEGEEGAVRVTADVTFVYPVAPAGGGDAVVRTIVRREVVMSWDDPAKVITEPGTFSLVSYRADMTNAGCGPATGRLTPSFGGGGSGTASGPAVDPYDRSTSMDERMGAAGDEECGTATRS